jgi:SnoaL-like protein
MPEITISAPDRAEAVWAMRDDVDIPEREGTARRRFMGAGHYREEYRRVGGQWKVCRLVLTRVRVDETTVRLGGPTPSQ